MEQDIISNYNCPVKTEYCLKHSISYRGKCPYCLEDSKNMKIRTSVSEDEQRRRSDRIKSFKTNRTSKILSFFSFPEKEIYLVTDIVNYVEWIGNTKEDRIRTIRDLIDLYEIEKQRTGTGRGISNKICLTKENMIKLFECIKKENMRKMIDRTEER